MVVLLIISVAIPLAITFSTYVTKTSSTSVIIVTRKFISLKTFNLRTFITIFHNYIEDDQSGRIPSFCF